MSKKSDGDLLPQKVSVTFLFICLCLAAYSTEAAMDDNPDKEISIFNAEKNEYEQVKKINKSEEEWREILTDEQYNVTREQGTERAFSGEYWDNKKAGIYKCVACGTDLFDSKTKFESGTGWPSFWEPVSEENVGEEVDTSFFMRRVEVHCARCKAHLGHVFPDGPPPTGQRFCINSAALKFVEQKD